MSIKKITQLVIIATIIVLSVYDAFALSLGGMDATISLTIWKTSLRYPVIPFASGFLCGHLFWQNTFYKDEI